METVDVKIGVLRSRVNRLSRPARHKIEALVSKIDEARALLAWRSMTLLSVPRTLAEPFVDQVAAANEALDGLLRRAFRQVSRLH